MRFVFYVFLLWSTLNLLPNFTFSQRYSVDDLEYSYDNNLSDEENDDFNRKVEKNGQIVNVFTSKFFINFLIPFLLPFLVYIIYIVLHTKSERQHKLGRNIYLILIFMILIYFQFAVRNLDQRQLIYKSIYDDEFYIKFYQETHKGSRQYSYLFHSTNYGNIDIRSISMYIFDILLLIYSAAVTIFLSMKIEQVKHYDGGRSKPQSLKYFFNIRNMKS
jgi:hypothetical protein